MFMYRVLCCWKRVFAMTSAFWQNSVSLRSASFCTPRANLPVTPGISWKASHFSILVWSTPWTVQFMGSQRVRHDWATFTFTYSESLFGRPALVSLVSEPKGSPKGSPAARTPAGWLPESHLSSISAAPAGRWWSQDPVPGTKSPLTNNLVSSHPHCRRQASDAHH